MSQKISKSDPISGLAEKSPRAVELLAEYGLVCAHCILNRFDTIEIGAQLHGMSPDEIDIMVAEINDLIESETAKKTDSPDTA